MFNKQQTSGHIRLLGNFVYFTAKYFFHAAFRHITQLFVQNGGSVTVVHLGYRQSYRVTQTEKSCTSVTVYDFGSRPDVFGVDRVAATFMTLTFSNVK
jgi:hypothetical protein